MKANKQERNIPAAILLGGLTGVCWSVLWAVITAKLVDMEKITFEAVGYAAMIIHLTAGIVASAVAWRKAGKGRLPVALGAGTVYYLMLAAVNALFFGGVYRGMGTAAVLVTAGALIPAMPAMAGKGRGRQIHYKIKA